MSLLGSAGVFLVGGLGVSLFSGLGVSLFGGLGVSLLAGGMTGISLLIGLGVMLGVSATGVPPVLLGCISGWLRLARRDSGVSTRFALKQRRE